MTSSSNHPAEALAVRELAEAYLALTGQIAKVIIGQKDTVDLLLTAQRQVGATLIVVTHDAQVAQRLQRTVKMRDGRIADDGISGR